MGRNNPIKNKVKVLDGGLGWELELRHPELRKDPLWSSRFLKENPDVIKQIHRSFLDAGCNVITTSSYQASVKGFMDLCKVSKEEAQGLIQKSIDIAKETLTDFTSTKGLNPSDYYVAASIGPYGACQHDMSEYTGNYVDNMSVEELKDWHRERLSLALSRNPDFVAFETIPAQKEAIALTELLKEYPDAKAWISFACKDEEHTCHNESFRDAVIAVLPNSQIMSVGINCCHPEFVMPLLNSVRDLLADGKTFVAYPNRLPQKLDGRTLPFPSTPFKPFSEYTPEWLKPGCIEWIGGCCNCSPHDIEVISKHVQDWNSSNE